MAKRLNNNEVIGLVDTSASEWINKISDGSKDHSIAVEKGITFFNGKEDTTGVKWDGVQELEVVIPTLADIVSNPVTLKGVINSAADVPSSASNGDLYYIGTSGSYFTPAVACEAGDMAVYYNSAWHVISGENQVSLAGTDLSIGASGTDVITVEGQTLALSLNFDDIRTKTQVVTNSATDISVVNGTVTVDPVYVALVKTSGSSEDITTSVSIDLPTSLASGSVTINENVLEVSNFTFTSGSLPTGTLNSASISIEASTNISVEGTFVTSVSAVGGVSLVAGAAAGNPDLTYVSGIAATSGTEFLTDIHSETAADEGKTPVFEIPGAVTVTGLSTFVSGLSDAAAAGANILVSDVTVGTVTGTFVSGLAGGSNVVVSNVTFGDAEKDTTGTRDWFVTGLEDSASAVTAVSFGEVVVTPSTSNAIVSASVSNHVLSFTTGTFVTDASAALSGTGVTTKAFTFAGVKLSGFDFDTDTLVTDSVSQASSTVSYKEVLTGSINVALGSATKYFAGKAYEHAYEAQLSYANISVTDASISTGSPSLVNTAITAAIPSNTVIVSVADGSLPTFSVAAATGTLTGSVGTSLSTSEVSWLAVNPDKKSIATGDSYSLTSDSSATGIVGNAISVAAADTYEVDNAKITIAADTYVTAVEIDSTAVSVKA